jgi:hypothetical protein
MPTHHFRASFMESIVLFGFRRGSASTASALFPAGVGLWFCFWTLFGVIGWLEDFFAMN